MKYITLLILITLFSCNKSLDLPNVDEASWQSDSNGCNGNRFEQLQSIQTDKDLIKGLNQDEIIAVLGKPDQNELYKRNQKFFIYNITPTNCPNKEDESPRQYLSIRFNATGLAKEIIIYQE
ncbi:hypothetical protein [Fulvivirga lutea]|uniref:Outer membrane protein assembly factor BamE n=1 Tax=Fulvivirga lutea TaxID=2810512 RepID=A0A974WE66_9BACT|nr:hypothetical protein [Fulvivirga lutea]QSE96659.1 hypothetical protein JR347_13790 [Fulvivirga lutea]